MTWVMSGVSPPWVGACPAPRRQRKLAAVRHEQPWDERQPEVNPRLQKTRLVRLPAKLAGQSQAWVQKPPPGHLLALLLGQPLRRAASHLPRSLLLYGLLGVLRADLLDLLLRMQDSHAVIRRQDPRRDDRSKFQACR